MSLNRNLKRIVPALIAFLLLCGCAAGGEANPPKQTGGNSPAPSATAGAGTDESPVPAQSSAPSPSVTEAANPVATKPGQPGETPQSSAPSGDSPISEDTLRALYESEGMPVQSITPYNGDYLVRYDGEVVWRFDWVYGKSGVRHKIMCCEEGVREVEIIRPGSIRVLTDGVYREAGYRRFPSVRLGYAGIELDENGEPLPYEKETGNSFRETYWADITEPSSLGSIGRREVVTNALVDVTGAQFVFGPPADIDGFSAFYAGTTQPPATEISFDEDSRVMTVIFRDTSLRSGEIPDFSKEQNRQLLFEPTLREQVKLPTEFPAGELSGSNPYISKATIEESGKDTVVRLCLTDIATEYTVETGKVGPVDHGPYIRIILHKRNPW